MKLARIRHQGRHYYARIEGSRAIIQKQHGDLASHEVLNLTAPVLQDTSETIVFRYDALLEPVTRVGKIIAIGFNYDEHAREAGEAELSDPKILAKYPSSIIGPNQPIVIDRRLTRAVDLEAELAVVIGRRTRRVTPATAMEHVFGLTCLNDVTARDLQFEEDQWTQAKSIDTFCPIGPWLVTIDEIGDIRDLTITSEVSGEVFQHGTTRDMIIDVPHLVSRLSDNFTLEPGDIIATGTPPGVGWFRSPPHLLGGGDEVRITIDGIGTLVNPVVEV